MTHTLSREELKTYEARLHAMLAESSAEARTLRSNALDATGEVHANRGDEASEEAALEPELAIVAGIEQRLDAVRAALARIRTGTYGVCAVCRRPIAHSRLDLIPFASECAACARQAEGNTPEKRLTGRR